MEAFSLLKYWRGGGGGSGSNTTFQNGRTAATPTNNACSSESSSSSGATTIVTTISPRSSNGDDGPFFDLQFTLPDETQNSGKVEEEEEEEKDKKNTISQTINIIDVDDEDDEEEDEQEVSDDHNISVTSPPSDENLFFKGSFVPIEPSSSLEGNGAKFPTSLSKSAAKFRVLMLKLKKPPKENIGGGDDVSSEKETQTSRKFFAVKFMKDSRKNQKSNANNGGPLDDDDDDNKEMDKEEDDNNFLKDVMHKYVKMIKPLHSISISKLKFSGQLMSFSGTAVVKGGEAAGEVAVGESNVKSLKKAGNISAGGLGLRVVCKHLGKSKSASLSATVPAAAAAAVAPSASRRRDDSLLQQQDGIQSAILHCKRSFNSSRDAEVSILSRSASEPSVEKSSGLSAKARLMAFGDG